MTDTIDQYRIEEALEKICTHHYFEKSPRNIRLLRYLTQHALNNKDVKEQTIGLDLFKESFDPNNNDGKVRVYMYNLRKKLKEYYTKYGKDDSIVFEIKKGQYNISFKSQNKFADKSSKVLSLLKRFKIPILLLLITFLTIITILGFSNRTNYCWDDFFESQAKNICVIADHYIVEERQDTGDWYATRIPFINTDNDLMDYIKTHDEIETRPTDYTLLSKMAPHTVLNLSLWFHNNDSKFSLSLDSKFRFEDTREHNIIYVGQFKTMNTSKGIFLKGSKVFSVYNDGFKYKEGDAEKTYTTSIENQNRIEYAMVSHIQLENGRKGLFFTSNHDIGTMATVKNFTDRKWLKGFYKALPENTVYYNALFEVTGLERTEMSCKLIHLEVIE